MIRNLIPWRELTRTGIPPLKVCRRDLVLGEVIVPVGETLDPELLSLDIRRIRLRQFYEMRLIEPVNAPESSLQFYRERAVREQAERTGMEVPVAPVQPVGSRIVAGIDLPGVDVPGMPDVRRKPKGAR